MKPFAKETTALQNHNKFQITNKFYYKIPKLKEINLECEEIQS